MLIKILKILATVVAAIVALLVLGALILAWTNRDIPLETLEQRFGGNDLQQLEIDGVSLRYRVEGEGPPLVLLHSHFYTMRQWDAWVASLKSDFTVIRYDLTSHGLTGPDPSGDYSRARGVALLDALRQHLNFDSIALAGSSTGGGIAWSYAAQHPQKVDALVLINAPGMPRVTNKYMEMALPSWFGHVLYLLPESLFRAFLEAPVVDNTLITDELLHEFHTMYRREGNRMAEFHRLLAWERGDASPQLSKISAPTLIMWGAQNPQLPVEHVQQYRAALINSESVESVIYPNIGHVIPLEIPGQSAEDVRTFLKGKL